MTTTVSVSVDVPSLAQGLAFYCCNREEKRLPDGTITRFADYPWRGSDRVLVDERCPWHQRHYRFRPPFYRPFDGPTRHRLALLAAVARAPEERDFTRLS